MTRYLNPQISLEAWLLRIHFELFNMLFHLQFGMELCFKQEDNIIIVAVCFCCNVLQLRFLF